MCLLKNMVLGSVANQDFVRLALFEFLALWNWNYCSFIRL